MNLFTTPRIVDAFTFAAQAHGDQKRKYTGTPYIFHPYEVACIVSTVIPGDEDIIIAALLHDVPEDTEVSLQQVEDRFGKFVGRMVFDLTDCTKDMGNRKTRKALDRERLRFAVPASKTIKLADFLSNTGTIVEHDPDFAVVYLREKEETLPALLGGHEDLYLQVRLTLEKSKRILENMKNE